MGRSDANFWRLRKEIAGLEQPRSPSAPHVDKVAEHFQSKMSNGRDLHDDRPLIIPERLWKIRYRSALRSLRRLDVSKAANGIPPVFLRECAEQLAPALTLLFRYIGSEAKYPTEWKKGRV